MKSVKESQVLDATRRANPKKKRVTFFIAEATKDALADWCGDNQITESGAIEEMIKATVPTRYFKERK